MLFDLDLRGHHTIYIQHLLRYWCQQEMAGHLDVVVSPEFCQQHLNIVNIAHNHKNINFVAISPREQAVLKSLDSFSNRILRAFQEWHLIYKYADYLRTTQCLIMCFDPVLFRVALGTKSPCPFSGIYFRPIFHYVNFTNYIPSWRERIWHWRDKLCLSRILRNSQLQTLFCLDPFAVKSLKKSFADKVVHLADPVPTPNQSQLQSERLKESLNIDNHRQVFLLFGSLSRRKGIFQLLEAILLLPSTLCQKLCLVLSGVPDPAAEKELIESKITAVCQSQPVQIISSYEFIPEPDVQAYFNLADVVLAPYQRHVGMSGILLLAAAAQKPVLSSNYGLMGELVQNYKLGLAVDSTVPAEIAKGLNQFLLKSPSQLCDLSSLKAFVEQSSVEKFASTVFQYL
ncbi:MAG: glycosyltransferase [Symploca sp. SIO1C4]|uniref:Glycosyltransferase n=1 Tax=Symploca sp. SIO1C4 TaxID=2607765 RepID=A0A6B3N7Y0_9CYAN|nr:glycosyltransferase [Symploca sp. SIO1C4]